MAFDYGATASANGFGNRIGWGKRPALVLIDVCKAYWTAGSPLDTSSNPASVASIDVIKNLVSAAREAKIPLIWTVVKYKNDMSDAGLFYSKAKQLRIWREGADEEYADWVEGLLPVEGEEVVPKRYVWSLDDGIV
jgi:nicotinamidase-related amidase